MARGQAAVAILNLVQVLDQQVAPARRVAEQGDDVLARHRIDPPPLRRDAPRADVSLPRGGGIGTIWRSVQAWVSLIGIGTGHS